MLPIGQSLRQSGQLVQHQRAGNGNVQGLTDTQHGDLDDMIQVGPHFRRESVVLVAEKYHAFPSCLTDLSERYRIFVEFDSYDLRSGAPCSFDPSEL